MRKLIVLAVSILPLLTFAQEKTGWSRTYGGELYERGSFLVECSDGNYAVLGTRRSLDYWNYNIWLIKIDNQGDTIWTKTYGSDADTSCETGRHMTQTSDSGFAIVGSIDTFSNRGMDIWLIRTDSKGDTLWTRTYRNGVYSRGRYVKQTSDSGFLIVGYFYQDDNYDSCYIWVIKTDSIGDTISTLTYRGDDYNDLIDVCDAHGEGVMIMASLEDYGGCGPDWFIHIDDQGKELARVNYCRPWDVEVYYINDFQKGHYSYVIVGLAYVIPPPSRAGLWFSEVEPEGDMETIWSDVWWKYEQDTGLYVAWLVQPALDGTYILVESAMDDADELVKRGSWKRTIIESISYVLPTSDSGFLVTGSKDDDLWLLKVDANGDTLASITENPAAPSNWYVSNPIGRTVSLQYSNSPTGFHASVFDASGRAVDEIASNLTQGTLTWGQGQNPGVYFIRPSTGVRPTARVVIVR